MDLKKYRIEDGKHFSLSDHDPADNAGLEKKAVVNRQLKNNLKKLFTLQDKLYAQNRYGLLIVIQAMDAAGKDGLIKHVLTGLNPQGTQVSSFKQPSSEELDHDYLWRINKALPRRGEIGIFNRSHYEEVIVTRVHDLVEKQQIPEALITKDIWQERFDQIANFEHYLHANGINTIKIFLHLSKDEQRDRLLERINNADKNWKFSASDVEERKYWDHYQAAYEHMIAHTATKESPWYIIPADHKWVSRYLASEAIVEALEQINPRYPQMPPEQKEQLEECKKLLETDL